MVLTAVFCFALFTAPATYRISSNSNPCSNTNPCSNSNPCLRPFETIVTHARIVTHGSLFGSEQGHLCAESGVQNASAKLSCLIHWMPNPCASSNIDCSINCNQIWSFGKMMFCRWCGFCDKETATSTTTAHIELQNETRTIEDINANLNAFDTIQELANLSIEIKGRKLKVFDIEELQTTADKIIQLHKIANPKMNFTQHNTSLFLEGDLLLTPQQLEQRIQSFSKRSRTKRKTSDLLPNWPTTINFKFDQAALSNAKLKAGATRATAFWSQNTCITFVQGSSTPTMVFTPSAEGCFSMLGMMEDTQVVNLGAGCERWGIAAHEVGHALGLYHEQSRPDRDIYVMVHKENIKDSMEANFKSCDKQSNCYADVPYDYGSNMHYGRFFFTRNKGQETLSPLQNDYKNTIGSRRLGPSFYDVKQINNKYCLSSCNNTDNIICQNGGYQNPNDCSKCLCPEPFSGNLCQDMKSGSPLPCGGKLAATQNFQALSSPNEIRGEQQCSWLIEASSKVELKFVKLGLEEPQGGFCDVAFVEIRTADLSNTGPRFCGDTAPTRKFLSNSTVAAVLLRSFGSTNHNRTGFTIQYRAHGNVIDIATNSQEYTMVPNNITTTTPSDITTTTPNGITTEALKNITSTEPDDISAVLCAVLELS